MTRTKTKTPRPIKLRVDDNGTSKDAPTMEPIPKGESGDYAIFPRVLPKGGTLKFNDTFVSFPEDRTWTILHHQGNVWMSDTPQETVSMAEAAKHARGDVLVTGLGLGVFQRLAQKAKSLTTLELQPDVVSLVWPTISENDARQRVIVCDAAEQMEAWVAQDEPRFDFIYLDTWDSGDYEHLPWINWFVRRAQELLRPGGEVMAWVYERAVLKYGEECVMVYKQLFKRNPRLMADEDKRAGMRTGWPMMGRFFDAIAEEVIGGKVFTPRQIRSVTNKIARTVEERPAHMEKAHDDMQVAMEMEAIARHQKKGK